MSTISQEELSRKYYFYHHDGLLDIFIGLGVLLAGAGFLAGMPWMGGIWAAIMLPVWASARKAVTYRRAGDVQPRRGERARMWLLMSVLVGVLALGVLTSSVFVLGSGSQPALCAFLDSYFNLALGAGLAICPLLIAAILGLPRYYAYALLTLAVFAAGQPLDWPFWIGLVAVGGSMTLAGCGVLARFIQTHPVQE